MYKNEARIKILEWYHLMIFNEFFVFVVIKYAKLAEFLSFWLKNINKS